METLDANKPLLQNLIIKYTDGHLYRIGLSIESINGKKKLFTINYFGFYEVKILFIKSNKFN